MISGARGRVVSALGVIEIFAWGTSYYLLAVLAGPIARDTGWSPTLITSGISIGLLVSGFSAGAVGKMIHRDGGRRVLAAGIVLVAVGLVLLGLARTAPAYLAAWIVIGLGMAGTLYDAAFSTLGWVYGRQARSAITVLTLWGGFASTICWPISAFLVEAVGWRATCFLYAAVHVVLILPLCLAAIPRRPATEHASDAGEAFATRTKRASLLYFLCVATAGTVMTVLASIWSVHLITILTTDGYALAAAVGLGTLIGPAQVGARILEMLGRERHHPVWTMNASTSLMLAGFLGLYFGLPAAAALVAYGAGNGLWSIARGSLPLALFGPRDYARTMGKLATPMLIAGAAAPLIGAFLIEVLAPREVLLVLALAATIPCLLAAVLTADILRTRPARAV